MRDVDPRLREIRTVLRSFCWLMHQKTSWPIPHIFGSASLFSSCCYVHSSLQLSPQAPLMHIFPLTCPCFAVSEASLTMFLLFICLYFFELPKFFINTYSFYCHKNVFFKASLLILLQLSFRNKGFYK